MATVRTHYSDLKIGDIVGEAGETEFRVVSAPKSWMNRGAEVWSVTTVAHTKPTRYYFPYVKNIGDEWVLQGSGQAAYAEKIA